MSSNIDKLNNLTDINFIDTDVDTLLAELISDYESEYLKETGASKTLSTGDPIRILLYANAARIYGILQSINQAAKQNLLKYATGKYLDQLAARVEVTREKATAAMATVRFELSAVQSGVVGIPSDTRVAAGTVYFKTTYYQEIPAGKKFVDMVVTCTGTGATGNGFTPGQINVLVDPIQYLAKVSNMDTSAGGADEEDDDSLRERVYLRPEAFSVAGPSGAYEYFTKEYSSGIADVVVTSLEAGTVNVYFIKEDGSTPESMITELQAYLSKDSRRPLTDSVVVAKPTPVNYRIAIDYYINKANSDIAESIQTKVSEAISAYRTWQRSKIGRDIDPGYLQYLIYAAGAKRVVVYSPVFTALSETEIACEDTEAVVNYKGLEPV